MGKSKQTRSFEETLARLTEIVASLEGGELELDRSLELFSEGKELIKHCNEHLVEAEERIKTLVESADGLTEIPGLKGQSGGGD